jgi:Septum formation
MRALFFIVTAVGLMATAACSGSTDDSSGPAVILVPTEVSEGEETPTVVPVGSRIGALWRLETGDCFNEYDNVETSPGIIGDLTTLVACSVAHDAEVFTELTHPAGAGVVYPGTTELNRWGTAECYGRFETFVGVEYELSELEIGVVIPEEPNWDAGPYRTLECYLFSVGGQLRDSMKGSNL